MAKRTRRVPSAIDLGPAPKLAIGYLAVSVAAAVVVAVVNVVEAVLPAMFPGWLRAEMLVVALLIEAVPNVIRAAVRRVAVLTTTHPVEVKAIREITTNLRRPDGTQRIDLLV